MRENERAQIIGFESVTEMCRKWTVLVENRSMDSNPNETDSNHLEQFCHRMYFSQNGFESVKNGFESLRVFLK